MPDADALVDCATLEPDCEPAADDVDEPGDADGVVLEPADIDGLGDAGGVVLEPADIDGLGDAGGVVLEPAEIDPDDEEPPGLVELEADWPDLDGVGEAVPEVAAPVLDPDAPEADVDDPDPDAPVIEPSLLAPGTIAGEPEVVDCEPVAVGRSDEGAVVDCANAGAASAVATRHAAICFFSIGQSPNG